jgi:heme exporter protein C
MYVHVPAAWIAYLCFAVVLVAGLRHWWRPSAATDRWGRAAAEVGVAATALTLLSGSVWGRAVWGVWWTWDPRLVSTAALLAVYVAHLALRALPGPEPERARRAALTGTAGFVLVPVVHFSVVWWTGLHQQATVLGRPGDVPPLDPRMGVALGLSVVAATAAALAAVVRRLGAHATPAAPAALVDPLASAPPTDPPLEPVPDPVLPGEPGGPVAPDLPMVPGPDVPSPGPDVPGPDVPVPGRPDPDLPEPSVPGPATQPGPERDHGERVAAGIP